ncbi:MAG: hypothetical protein OSW77_12960, partial [Proteobacteria bacterium]|nr:hypothetical protein [Pseudomonadota bacterium]
LWAMTEEIRALAQVKRGQGTGQPLDGLLREARVWGPRLAPFRAATQRLDTRRAEAALAHAASIDRIIKGAAGGDPWNELLRLGLRPGGRAPPLRGIVTGGSSGRRLLGLIRRKMLPRAGFRMIAHIVQAATAFFLHQAHPLAAFGDDNDAQLGVDRSFAVPVAAGRADLHFGRQYQFSIHSLQRRRNVKRDGNVGAYAGFPRQTVSRRSVLVSISSVGVFTARRPMRWL